jgi:hypothetical protein
LNLVLALLYPLYRLVGDSDRLNLNERLGRVEGCDLDDRVGRIRKREVAASKLDDLGKLDISRRKIVTLMTLARLEPPA